MGRSSGRTWLRKQDQLVIAVGLWVGWGGMGLWYLATGGAGGHLVDIDRAVPKTIEFRVDVNQAPVAELALLPGIGPVIAERIIQSRQREGLYRSWSELQRVRGIGPKTLARMRPYLEPIPPQAGGAEQ